MKILVTVKRVINPYVKVRVKTDLSGVEMQNVKMSLNPFDEIALEEAVRLREQGIADEIIAVSIGKEGCQETLRHALALGVDKGIFIRSEQSNCSLNIAKIMVELVNKEKPNLILMGKQSIDGDNNQTPQMLAALLDWPQVTFASQLIIKEGTAQVMREVDGGLELLEVSLPAVISADLRLNEPRYASLPNIMKAKSKPLAILDLEALNLNLSTHVEVLSVTAPPIRQAGIIVDTVQDLVDKLRYQAKVL